MKIIVLFILSMSLISLAVAEQHIIASATLKTKNESVSTPPVDLSLGGENIARAKIEIGNREYLFALKSSGIEKNGKFKYNIALSLSNTGKDDFIISKSGETDSFKPMDFSFVIDGISYEAVVILTPK